MTPENIKIDEDGDFEISYIDREYQECILYFTFEQIEEAYLLSKSKKYPESVKYGCHVEDEILDDCVFDGNYSISDCKHAERLNMDGKCKTDCQYWRPIEVKK